MSRFYRKKLNAQGRYINPPVHAKPKTSSGRKFVVGSETKLYKFERGPLKETSTERTIRIAKEAEERYYARQAEKEAGKMFKRKTAEEKRVIAEAKRKAEYDALSEGQKRWADVREMRRLQRTKRGAPAGMYKRSEEVRQRMRESAKKRWAGLSPVLTKEEKRLKHNAYQNARNQRLSAERRQKKSTAFVITITITDPNKS
jgi:hypothetical protein